EHTHELRREGRGLEGPRFLGEVEETRHFLRPGAPPGGEREGERGQSATPPCALVEGDAGHDRRGALPGWRGNGVLREHGEADLECEHAEPCCGTLGKRGL